MLCQGCEWRYVAKIQAQCKYAAKNQAWCKVQMNSLMLYWGQYIKHQQALVSASSHVARWSRVRGTQAQCTCGAAKNQCSQCRLNWCFVTYKTAANSNAHQCQCFYWECNAQIRSKVCMIIVLIICVCIDAVCLIHSSSYCSRITSFICINSPINNVR